MSNQTSQYVNHAISESQKRDVFARKMVAREKNQEAKYIQACKEDAALRNLDLLDVDGYLKSIPYWNLQPLSPDAYIRENLVVAPPVTRKRPTKADAEKYVGVTFRDRLFSVFSSQKREELSEKKERAKEILQEETKRYELYVEKDNDDYRERYDRATRVLKAEIDRLSNGDPVAASRYFTYALSSDNYSVDGESRYSPEPPRVTYLPDVGELLVSYQVPESGEIPRINRFFYSETEQRVTCSMLDAKKAASKVLRVAESVLLRVAALAFLSDAYEIVSTVSLTGYLRYDDSAYGNYRTKNVIHCRIGRDTFNEITLGRVNPLDLFERVLKADISPGLYEREPYDLSEVAVSS